MRYILFASLVLFGCTTSLKNRTPASDESHEPTLTFEETIQLIKEGRASTVGEAIQILTEKYPKFFISRTMMYDSLSLHESSFEEPRVIAFGKTADFVLTFNGSAKQRGGYAIETMEFDRTDNQFKFREIAFKKEMKPEDFQDLPKDDIEFQDQYIKVSKANPQRCLQCHGDNPNPIWETYFNWPGAYGSNDDILTTLFNDTEVKINPNYDTYGLVGKKGVSIGRMIGLKKQAPDAESEGFRRFIRRTPEHDRFSHLPPRALDSAFVRWNKGENKSQIDTSAAIASEIKEIFGENSQASYAHERPNLRLMNLLYKLTSERLWNDLVAHSKTLKLPNKLYWISNCSVFGSFQTMREAELMNHTDPLRELGRAFSQKELAAIRSRAGDWQTFLKRHLTAELNMESEKISRYQRVFGKDQIVKKLSKSHGRYPNDVYGRPSESAYSSKGIKYSENAKMLFGEEAEYPALEALVAYVAAGSGVDLANYATNMRRVASFRDGGMGPFYDRVRASFGVTEMNRYVNICDQVLD